MKTVTKILEMAKENGYRSFESTREEADYGWMITPNNNILYIQKGDFGYGYNMSLQYAPSKQKGSGCRCNEDTISEITVETLKKMEMEGLKLAIKLKAKLYTENEVNEYFSKYWDTKNVKQL